jgi:hypothetical protein
MTRLFALTVAIVLPLSLATTTSAQTTPYDDYVPEAPTYGVAADGSQPYGGFGLEYSQALLAGSMVMDQYGLLHVTPAVEAAPAVAAAPPRPPTRISRSAYRRVKAQPRYQLPTGSLGQSGSNGVILYSPGVRYQNYGSGYERGPYGVVDYSYMYKGWPLGY